MILISYFIQKKEFLEDLKSWSFPSKKKIQIYPPIEDLITRTKTQPNFPFLEYFTSVESFLKGQKSVLLKMT